jgi:HAD superfamily hydrolase (TIGR01484 family)
MPAFDLLAIDLDGTLLGGSGVVSAVNAKAVQAARDAGVRVVICTGRGLAEARVGIDGIKQREPVVVAGGSITADPVSGRTIHRATMDEELVHEGVQTLHEHGHAALVLKDRADAGYDYLVVHGEENHELDPVTNWWFSTMGVHVRSVKTLHEDEHPEHTVRIGACAPSGVLTSMEAQLRKKFGERAVLHNFPAVVAPHEAREHAGKVMHVLEVFDSQATKWRAIERLAKDWGIEHRRIAAIGDEINDLDMIRGAGLGIAMGNAIAAVKAAAKRETKSNREDGVAWAIERVMSGEWA